MLLDSVHNEKELLLYSAGGDEIAFAKLFKHWYPMLLAFVTKVTQSREVAEEIVQDVFTQLWLQRAELENINHLQAYLFVLARNRALNELEKIATYHKLQKKYARQKEQDSRLLQAGNESTEIIEKAIGLLTARQREVWLLHRRQQYTYEEIAYKLGISKETVKTHLKAATEVISHYLKGRQSLLLLLSFSLTEIIS